MLFSKGYFSASSKSALVSNEEFRLRYPDRLLHTEIQGLHLSIGFIVLSPEVFIN
jgi:hypothetical protein